MAQISETRRKNKHTHSTWHTHMHARDENTPFVDSVSFNTPSNLELVTWACNMPMREFDKSPLPLRGVVNGTIISAKTLEERGEFGVGNTGVHTPHQVSRTVSVDCHNYVAYLREGEREKKELGIEQVGEAVRMGEEGRARVYSGGKETYYRRKRDLL
jgi:hypothetical protein